MVNSLLTVIPFPSFPFLSLAPSSLSLLPFQSFLFDPRGQAMMTSYVLRAPSNSTTITKFKTCYANAAAQPSESLYEDAALDCYLIYYDRRDTGVLTSVGRFMTDPEFIIISQKVMSTNDKVTFTVRICVLRVFVQWPSS